MKIPNDFGMKKEKARPEFIEISGKFIRNALLCSFGVLIIAVGVVMAPWEELRASLVTPGEVPEIDFLEEIKAMNMTLRAIQQKDSTVKSGSEYLLVKDMNGAKSFIINENTCTNGARLIVRLNEESRGMQQPLTGSIQITGIAAQKNRGVYNAVITVDDAMPAQMRNLPNDMIIENDTVFLTYKISKGENANRVKYMLECY